MSIWKALKKTSGTGWKELERESGTGWKALEWENIDVGAVAQDGSTYMGGDTRTILCKTNPANADGALDKLDVYVYSVENGNLRVGMVYLISGSTYKCRSAVDLTNLSLGLNSDIPVNLSVETGDYIAVYAHNTPNDAEVDVDSVSGAGRVYEGNALIVGSQYNYINQWNYELKVYASNY